MKKLLLVIATIACLFSCSSKEEKLQEAQDLLKKAETIDDFEEVWEKYQSLTDAEKAGLGVPVIMQFKKDYLDEMGTKLTPEDCAVLMTKGILDEIDKEL